MNPEKKRQRDRIRAGYGQQPWGKFIIRLLIVGIRMKIREIFRKEE